jgi:trehalose 6-phosphate phosphatase
MRLSDPAHVAREIRARSDGRHLLVLCDFDGTLAEFDPDPHAVWLPPPLRDALTEIAGRGDATVGLVSGRRLDDIRARSDLGEDAYYAGFHGLEIQGEGAKFVHPDVHGVRDLIQSAAAAMAADLHGLGGVFLENKGLSIVVHFRAAAADAQLQAQDIFERNARPYIQSGQVKTMRGACARELMPNIRWSKGTAVAWICDRVERRHGPTWPVYIGDDVTDEDALRFVNGRGTGVAASDRVSGADFMVDGPAAVETLLHVLRRETERPADEEAP